MHTQGYYLEILKLISKKHLVGVERFSQTELHLLSQTECCDIGGVYKMEQGFCPSWETPFCSLPFDLARLLSEPLNTPATSAAPHSHRFGCPSKRPLQSDGEG
ncbi:hypothetical protein Q8A67_024267 [Cirrhinus molitorella]|uniref:Uncharacterized protein n=1 Tax=Cirrhinus molitorella TaxID=172907 RepID=A0AA88NZT6_9TELE|nr:hypothetical protein Q8A67_024267 [Cirrhinus molitorella]